MVTRTSLNEDLEERVDDPQAAIAAHIGQAVRSINTCLPGIIRSFDVKTQTATVQPAIRRIFSEKGSVDLPQLLDVPVYFPAGGGFAVTFPVSKNDECVLVFSQRAIDNWFENGGVQEPSELRTHDLSDALAFVGFSSKPRKIQDVAEDAIEIRSRDGSTRLSLDSVGRIKIGSDGKTPMNALIHGVMTGQDPCPVLGVTHGSFGCGSPFVFAKGKT